MEEDEHFSDADDEESGSEKVVEGRVSRSHSPGPFPRRNSLEEPCLNAYDQFDNCLQVTDVMDSVLAFYYTEESDPGVVKVTEIFAVDEPHS